jgi:hypothetical protein
MESNMRHLKHKNGELLFWKEALKFTNEWARKFPTQPWVKDKTTLQQVARMAADPNWAAKYYHNIVITHCYDALKAGASLAEHLEIHRMADLYQCYPDFMPALLNHLRKHWAKLENSKFGRLKKFIALAFAVNPHQKEEEEKLSQEGRSPYRYLCEPGPYKPGSALSDDQLTIAFEKERQEVVSKSLVTKARQWVYDRMAANEELEKTFFDTDGTLKPH